MTHNERKLLALLETAMSSINFLADVFDQQDAWWRGFVAESTGNKLLTQEPYKITRPDFLKDEIEAVRKELEI